MNQTLSHVKATAKAVVAMGVVAAGYLVGVLSGDQGLGDVTTVQWLGLVVFMGGAYGLTYAVPNRPVQPVRLTGTVTSHTTGASGSIDATVAPDPDPPTG